MHGLAIVLDLGATGLVGEYVVERRHRAVEPLAAGYFQAPRIHLGLGVGLAVGGKGMPPALERHRLHIGSHRLDDLGRKQAGNATFGFELGVVDDDVGMEDALFAGGFAGSIVIVISDSHLEAADALALRASGIKPFGCPLVYEISEVVELDIIVLLVQRDDHMLVGSDLCIFFDRHVVAEDFSSSVHYLRPVPPLPVAVSEVEKVLV